MPAQRIRAFLRCFLTSVFFALRAFLRIRFNVRCFLRQCSLRFARFCEFALMYVVFYVSFSLRFARFCEFALMYVVFYVSFSLRFARFFVGDQSPTPPRPHAATRLYGLRFSLGFLCFLRQFFFALRAFLRIRFNVRCFLRQFFFALRAFFCGGPVPHAPTPLRGFMACVLAWVFFVFYVSFSLRFTRFL